MMPNLFNKPDLKAPRHHCATLNVLEPAYFTRLKKAHPVLRKYTVTQIREVIWKSNIQLYKDIIEYRDGVEFPEFLGYSFIGTCPKPLTANVNIKTSLDLGHPVEHRNFESDRFLAKIFYTNYETRYRFKFHDLWTFKACRNFSREVAKKYPTQWKKYIQVDHTLKISRMYRREKARINHNIKTDILLEHYNEFEGF